MTNRRALIKILILVLVTGCAVQPGPSKQPPRQYHTIQGLLQASAQTDNASLRQEYQLAAAKRLQDDGEHDAAHQLLDAIENSGLDAEQQDLYQWLRARVIRSDGDKPAARALSQRLDRDLVLRLPEADRVAALQDLAQLHRMAGASLREVRLLFTGYDILEKSAWPDLNEHIWKALRSTALDDLRGAAERATDARRQGWLELAIAVLTTDRFAIEARAAAIRNWQQNWPTHPASTMPPRELRMLARLPDERPEKIALALPLSGPLSGPGQAVREGFMAAFYQRQKTGEQKDLALTLYDTNNGGFSRIYARLLETDPDLVIGPLRKESLSRLKSQTQMPIPVLALNYTPDPGPTPEDFYQFGLASEDEVRQVAERLHAEGHHNALLFAPASEWGNRMTETFRSALQRNPNARMLRAVRYDEGENFNRVVADGFAINRSRQRANELMRLTGTTMKYEPRRRQDIDAIVLLASPENARQFNPLFAFYYGGNLPVYGTSLLYQGDADPSRDSDLDGITFTDTPWILDPGQTLRPLLNRLFPSLGESYDRLFALGVDSYHLANRLSVFREVPGYRIQGRTGVLEMKGDGSIMRQQVWAQFRGGRPDLVEQAEAKEKNPTMED